VDQRYEAASTLYGPHTLAAYQQLYSAMAAALAQGQAYPAGPTPPNLVNSTVKILFAEIFICF
jgi:neutral ceramidase